MKITKKALRGVSTATILLTCAACSTPTPQIDSRFGQAVYLLTAQQVLHPDAAANTNPAAGIDGVAGKSAYDEYQKSFRVPTPPSNAFTIGVGGK